MKMTDPIDPDLILRWRIGAAKFGFLLSVFGALALILSIRTGLALIGAGAVLIFYFLPSRSQRKGLQPRGGARERRDPRWRSRL